MANEKKGNAGNTADNAYREERKKRLAKAAKQKNKKMHDSTDVIATVIKTVLCLALVAGLIALLFVFGLPQKLMPAIKVDGRSYSVAEYNYYYSAMYQRYAEQANYYQQNLGFNLTGFDYTKDPAAQTSTEKDEDGNALTYDEVFQKGVKTTLESTNYYLKKAAADGMTLSEEHAKEIDDQIASIKSYADISGYSLNRYISEQYGKGLNEKMLRSLLEDQYLAAQYLETQTEGLKAEVKDEDIEAAYKENSKTYDAVDIRLFGLKLEDDAKEEPTTAANEEETTATAPEETATEEPTTRQSDTEEPTTQQDASSDEPTTQADADTEKTRSEILAEEMLGKLTDEDSFIALAEEYCAEADKETFKDPAATLQIGVKYDTVKSNISEDMADWLFDESRAEGDKRTCKNDEYVFVVMMKKTPYREDTPLVSARHILVSFDSIAAELEKTKTDDETDTSEETDSTAPVTAEDGTEITAEGKYSGEVVLAAYDKAKDILNKYESGEKTEDAFAALAEEYSDDTGSVGENTSGGGLYEDIAKGRMVAPFEEWIYDASRQPGDVGLVRTNYGWHVMYFVGAHEEPSWKETIRETLTEDKTSELEEAAAAEYEGTASESLFARFAKKEALKLVNKYTSRYNEAS